MVVHFVFLKKCVLAVKLYCLLRNICSRLASCSGISLKYRSKHRILFLFRTFRGYDFCPLTQAVSPCHI